MAKRSKNNYEKRNNNKTRDQYKSDTRSRGNHDPRGKSESDFVGRENDPAWYNVLNTLVTDVTKIPFNTQIGRTIANTVYDGTDLNIPGIIALDYICIPGIAKQASDGVNIAATGLFQTIRKDLSTYASYASADTMMYVLGQDNIIQLYNCIKRAFGTANLYSSVNYNYSNALLRAQGFTDQAVTDFRANMGIYIARFNNLVYKASTLYLPQQFSIIKRHAWMFSNFFIDGKDAKSQIYMHRPKYVFKLDETVSDNGTALVPIEVPLQFDDFNEVLDLFDSMLESFRNSDSMNKIAADMKRAIPGQTWQYSYVTMDYMVTPVYSQEVLSQIENTVVLPPPLNTGDNLYITQSVDKNIILFDPVFMGSGIADSTDPTDMSGAEENYMHVPGDLWKQDLIINMHWENPSSDDIAVATRNMNMLYTDEANNNLYLTSAGSDICVGMEMVWYETGSESVITKPYFRFMTTDIASDIVGEESIISTVELTQWSAFDWSPMLYLVHYEPDNAIFIGASPLCEFANYTTIDRVTLDRIHNNIIASMWSVPQFGTITK